MDAEARFIGVANGVLDLQDGKFLDHCPDGHYVTKSLDAGRPVNGESQEDAGFRQAEVIMELFSEDDL